MFLDYCYCHLCLTFTVKIYREHRKHIKKCTWVFTCVSQSRQTSCWLALFLPPSGWQQWAESPNRRLPLCEYNLWSISIIGGVCRDSYSNNYPDWRVSKATNILIHPEWGEGKCFCVCKCIAWHGDRKKPWDLSFVLSNKYLHINTCKQWV